MPIDLSQVTAITIPEGEVTKIECNGTILWELGSPQVVVESITLSGQTTTFNVGNTFSFGGTVTANYSDGTTADVTSSTTFSGYNMSSAGTQTVTASYTENGVTVTATYSITVYKVLTKITLSGQTTSLNRGATFSFGGTVTATYNDGSTATVTSSTTFSGYNMSKAGTYTVTASYTYRSVTKTATYSLTVNKAWSQTWSGSKTCKVAGYTVTGGGDVGYTVSGKGYNVQIRLTFTMTNTGGSGYTATYQKWNGTALGSETSTKPSSPFSFTINVPTGTTTVLRTIRNNSGTKNYVNVNASRDTTNNRVKISLTGIYSGYPASAVTTSITLTKIEQYY